MKETRPKDAIADLMKALELRPSRFEAHADLAAAYYDLGKEDLALAEWQKAERHLHEFPEPGQWRHGDFSTARPEYFDRPEDERELVRHKAFVGEELTSDEAAFDMDQLDYDFHLYRDLATGQYAVLERTVDGDHVVHLLESAPVLTVAQAIERLRDGGEPSVFFADAITGRGDATCRSRNSATIGLAMSCSRPRVCRTPTVLSQQREAAPSQSRCEGILSDLCGRWAVKRNARNCRSRPRRRTSST